MNQRNAQCIEQESALVLFASGELESDALSRLHGHCEVCADCRAERDAQLRIAELLRAGLERRELSPGLWAGIQSELAREGRIAAAPRTPVPTVRRFPWKGLAASAAAAALFALGLWLGQSEPRPTPSVAPVAAVIETPAPRLVAAPGNSLAPMHGLRPVGASELPLAATAEPLTGAPLQPLEWIPASPGASTASHARLLH